MISCAIKKTAALLSLTLATLNLSAELKPVALDSEQIVVKGAKYVSREAKQIEPLRFSKELLELGGATLNFNPDVARMASGVRMLFCTDSSEIQLNLRLKPFRRPKAATVQVYRDGELLKSFEFRREREDNPVAMALMNPDDHAHRYRVDLPSTAETVITGWFIDAESKLLPVVLESKPVYVALGDSITHGSAALDGISALSYPALLGERLGFDVYNLGVGGSRVSVKGGEMLADWDRIDLMTLLIGANDFSWAAVPPDRYRRNYETLLNTIRRIHPKVPLYCITLTYTTRAKGDSGHATEDYRQVVREVVEDAQKAGDEHLFLLEGDELTGPEDLADWVHLNAKGNRRFAAKLYKRIMATPRFYR